jgi:hypothetical protein
MADKKISELDLITTISHLDVVPIVDVSESTTKKITLDAMHQSIGFPYMCQSDSTDQAIANVTLAQLITFNTDVSHSGITRTSSSRFTIPNPGTYLITFSAIVYSTSLGKVINIWIRKDGTDIASSNTPYTFKSNGIASIITVTFIETFTANQYFELWMWGDDTGVKLDATAAGTSPTRPASPSIIMTVNKISGEET